MKKHYILLLTIILSLGSHNLYASHYMGGEITWECIPSGQPDAGKYIFQMKVYRECAGLQFGSTLTLTSNSPVSSILVTEIQGWPKDISPICSPDSNLLRIQCAGATLANGGAIEEHIYRSLPIQISGTPPATGWEFYWGSTARNPATNIAQLDGWKLRAIMYPSYNKNAYPCFDSSPQFAASPRTVITAGYPFTYGNIAIDPDMDSLRYNWGIPVNHFNNPINYATGYNYQNQLPSTIQNINNIAATLDSASGLISFKSYTAGAFLTCMKVTSFNCDGSKKSEIWREVQYIIVAQNINTPPLIVISSYNYLNYDTTVYAGDSINLNIIATDFQFQSNGSPQKLSINQFGSQFGSFIPPSGSSLPTLSSTSGCDLPPCATLYPANGPNYPLQATFGVQTTFRWKTDCNHLANSSKCANKDNIYYFYIDISDDNCPIPASQTAVIRIKIKPSITFSKPIVKEVHYNYTQMTADFSWEKVQVPDSFFYSYDIYHSNSFNGPYTLIDSISNRHQIVYSHNIGLSTQAYYYIRTRIIGCAGQIAQSVESDTLSLNITSINNSDKPQSFELFQNQPNPSNNLTIISYAVNRTAKGKFQLIDISGRSILEKDLQAYSGENEFELDTSTLPNGIYYYRISFNGISKTKKLIVLR